jgi:CheY-like chemotaxis protein
VTLLTPAEICADVGATQRITLPLPPAFQGIVAPLKALSVALNRLTSDVSDKSARAQLATQGSKLAHAASPLGGHPIVRLSLAIEGMLQECIGRPDSPNPTQIQTLQRATDLIASLLDPRNQDQGKALPHPKVLAVDKDSDLLHTLAASLELAHLPTTTCSNSHDAQTLIEKEDYDLLVLDDGLQNGNGRSLCERLRENDRHRTTPVILLTVAGPDQRSQTGLRNGQDSLRKPFNTAELAVKAETWIWKKRFGLL